MFRLCTQRMDSINSPATTTSPSPVETFTWSVHVCIDLTVTDIVVYSWSKGSTYLRRHVPGTSPCNRFLGTSCFMFVKRSLELNLLELRVLSSYGCPLGVNGSRNLSQGLAPIACANINGSYSYCIIEHFTNFGFGGRMSSRKCKKKKKLIKGTFARRWKNKPQTALNRQKKKWVPGTNP